MSTCPCHVCERCGTQFARRDYLIAHLKRKNPCNPINVSTSTEDLLAKMKKSEDKCVKCPYCEKLFSCEKSKKHHELYYCKKKDLKEELKQDRKRLRHLEKVVADLQSRLNTNGSNLNIAGNNYINCTINVMNSFGQENIDYVVNDKAFIEKCLRNITHDGMKNLLEKIHYSPEHPENNNVRLKSLRNDLFEVYNDQKWE